MQDDFSLIRRLSQIGTRLHTKLRGVEVGCDSFGNRYYRAKKTPKDGRESRWVIYQGEPEASKVPPEWHIWLHHIAKAPIPAGEALQMPWQKPHMINPTGTAEALYPPGHFLRGPDRVPVAPEYLAWRPKS
ncbi:MAG: NADH:ubiquinone oxidoreductase subunit NDUFA12 [Alphaproteobacteria bacterium]|nr:NADH:ubiquinone oxidoreductase subunit NDUFA12 [Alphaproteobacteria bacterium]